MGKPVKTSTTTWNDEAKKADPAPEDRTAYRWSNGAKKDNKKPEYV